MKKLKLFLPAILLILAFLALETSFKSKSVPAEKPEVIYVYDPLCGWCYGFTPVMIKLKEKYGDSVKFSVVSGGMIMDGGPVGELAEFFRHAHKGVEEKAKVKFGDAFINGVLNDGTMFFSSKPPSLALTVFKSIKEEKSLEFAHAIQKMIYYDGKDLNKVESYTALLASFEVDSSEFVKRYADSTYKSKTIDDFKYSTLELKVTGYPTVFLKTKGKLKLLTRGYDSYEKVEAKLRSHL